jgi:hypothetical protein
MRNTDGNIDGNTGDANGNSNCSVYAWLLEHDLDRQYCGTWNDTCDGQQL